MQLEVQALRMAPSSSIATAHKHAIRHIYHLYIYTYIYIYIYISTSCLGCLGGVSPTTPIIGGLTDLGIWDEFPDLWLSVWGGSILEARACLSPSSAGLGLRV